MEKAFKHDIERLAAGQELDYYELILKAFFASRAGVSEGQAYDFLERMCEKHGGVNVGSPEQGIEDYAFDFSKVATQILNSFD